MSVAPAVSARAAQAAGGPAAQPATGATTATSAARETRGVGGVRGSTGSSAQTSAVASEFEQMLAGELSQALVQSSGIAEGAGGEGEGEAGSEGGEAGAGGVAGGSQLLTTFVPQALGESLARDGGLGLTGALTNELGSTAASASTASGGAAA